MGVAGRGVHVPVVADGGHQLQHSNVALEVRLIAILDLLLLLPLLLRLLLRVVLCMPVGQHHSVRTQACSPVQAPHPMPCRYNTRGTTRPLRVNLC